MEQMANHWGWQQAGLADYLPATAIDGRRVYANWMGVVFAIDLSTGKLQWRTAAFNVLDAQLNQLMYSQSADVRSYGISAGGGSVLAVAVAHDRINYHQEPARLICLDAANGSVRWTSEKVKSLSDWSFLGSPHLLDGSIHALAVPRQGRSELHMLVLAHDTGELQWQASLGTVTAKPTMYGRQVIPLPELLFDGGTLYVLGGGKLLAFDLHARTVRWAFSGEAAAGVSMEMMQTGVVVQSAPGGIFKSGDVLCFKDEGAQRLYALDVGRQEVLWSRAAGGELAMAGDAGPWILLSGHEILALERKTGRIGWYARLPAGTRAWSPLVTGDGIVVTTNRGLYRLELQSGKRTWIDRSVGVGSPAARLFPLARGLLVVTNEAIICHGLKPNGGGNVYQEEP
jgi:outer membrane protein assembly factor BamB